jgi:hypothetical protein
MKTYYENPSGDIVRYMKPDHVKKKKKKKKHQNIAYRGQNNKFSPAAPGH